MNFYEKIVILDSSLDDTAIEETVTKIKDLIIKHGGEILKTEKWGRRKLAYELNKHQKGYYVLILFKSPPPTIAEIERFCKIVDPIIKFMVVKLTKKKQIAAVTASLAKAEAAAQDIADEAKPVQETAVDSGEAATPPATGETAGSTKAEEAPTPTATGEAATSTEAGEAPTPTATGEAATSTEAGEAPTPPAIGEAAAPEEKKDV